MTTNDGKHHIHIHVYVAVGRAVMMSTLAFDWWFEDGIRKTRVLLVATKMAEMRLFHVTFCGAARD